MSIEIIVAWLSFGVSLANAAGVAVIYLHYIKNASAIICTVRSTATGEVLIDDPFSP